MFIGYIIKRKNVSKNKKTSFVYLSKDNDTEESYGWAKTLEFKDIYFSIDAAMSELIKLHCIPQYKEDIENGSIYIIEMKFMCTESENKLTYNDKNNYWDH